MATQLNNWLSIDKVSGTGNAQITLTASSYSELVDRAASIKIQAQTTNAILNVRQNALVPSAALDSYEITTYGGGTYTNGITSNVPWTAVVNGDWITIDKTQGESGYTTLSITLNDPTEARNGSIVFNAEGVVLTLQIYQIYDLKQAYFWVEFENTDGTISGLTNTYTDMYHSFDGITWLTTPKTLSMGSNRLVYFKNNSMVISKYANNKINYLNIRFNKRAIIGGDLSSLTNMASFCCYSLFSGNSYLIDASQLKLSWNSINYFSCENMFSNCTNLIAGPNILAMKIGESGCANMFSGCKSLRNAPSILPATVLGDYCYSNMFENCSSLKTAPVLPAPTLEIASYQRMFYNCSSLNYIKMLATNIKADACLRDWVDNVASTGTFIKHPNTRFPMVDGIPDGWTVETATS